MRLAPMAAPLAALTWAGLLAGCPPARAPAPERAPELAAPAGAGPGEVLGRFAAAVEAGRWDEAWPLLAARWRARSTPARLAGDLAAAGPVGREALARVRALLAAGAPLAVGGEGASLSVGEGRAARLVREDGGWRVDALE